MEPYVSKWYAFFKEGKIMGLRCQRCGSTEFPPVTVCFNCAGTDLRWVEMSGKGTLIAFTVSRFPHPTFPTFAPYHYGTVVLEEGPSYAAMILGIEPGRERELFDKLPVSVTAEVQPRDGYSTVAFRVGDF
jgi:uncharacterized OB-fold protein